MKPMNPTVKQKWTEALRSGDYPQSRGYLQHRDNGFCCLGVLCDLYRIEVGDAWIKTENGYEFMDDPFELPRQVFEWAGLDSGDPAISTTAEGSRRRASMCNDDYYMTFDEIANLIEENL